MQDHLLAFRTGELRIPATG